MANLEAIIGAVEVLREELPKLHGTLNYAGDVGRFHGMQNMTNENVVRLERLFQVFVTAQDHTNEQLLQQQRDLMDRIRNLEGALMVGRATYTFLSSDCNGSGTHSMDSRTQDYPSPESMVLSLPREDVSMSENSFAEESDEETLRKLQEELMGMPESTKDIIDMISDARHISPEHERGSTKSGVQTPTVHRSPVSSTKGSRSSSVRRTIRARPQSANNHGHKSVQKKNRYGQHVRIATQFSSGVQWSIEEGPRHRTLGECIT